MENATPTLRWESTDKRPLPWASATPGGSLARTGAALVHGAAMRGPQLAFDRLWVAALEGGPDIPDAAMDAYCAARDRAKAEAWDAYDVIMAVATR